MKKIIFIPLIFLFNAAFAQSLTLQDAINIALKKSLDIQLQKNNVDINTINNNYGVAGGLPVVSASANDNEQSTFVHQKLNSGEEIKRNGAVGNNLTSGVTAGILLYNGSRVVATKEQLAKLQSQSEQVLNSLIQNTMASVMTTYYDIVRQQSYLKAIDKSIDVAQQQLKIVQTQRSVGMANDADLFQSQINLNNLVQQRQAQLLVIDQAKTGLLLLLNLRPDSSLTVADTAIEVDKNVVLGNILDDLGKNADIIAADEQVKINQLIVKETAAQRYPSLRANIGYNYSRSKISAGNFLLNESSGPTGGLSLAIPIYNGSVYKRQQKVAEINVQNAELQKDILTRNYKAQAVQAYQAYASAIQQLDSQRVNVELAQKLIDLMLYKFQLREATIVELTQAQQSFQQAAYSYTNISFAAKSSEIELKRLVNEIPF
ncbi:MAG TPA: TolC family protein [Chitinophagaceae bacterium]|nr:TolC family protein [Chitinophagaceae bacterium]